MSVAVTVVIPAYKRSDLLRKAVASVLRMDFDPQAYEVIVVDSSPDDANRMVVEGLQGSARCPLRFYHKKPEGPGPSRNLGARSGTGDIIAFLDSDCVASPNWLSAGVAAFAAGVGIVQGRTSPDPTAKRGLFTWYVSIDAENYFYETCNIFYRRGAFEQGGGFSHDAFPTADIPLGGEDVELAWRVKRLGWQVVFAADALVHHEVIPIPVWRWICEPRLYLCAEWVRRVPELRRYFVGGYFYNWHQAFFTLGLAGCAGAFFTSWCLLAWAPYVIGRSSEPTKTLRGPLRALRALVYAPRDAASFCLLVAGSVRARTTVL